MTRKQKIDLLKGIARGERSISEIVPTTYEIWFVDNEAYTNQHTGEEISLDEYKQRFGEDKTIHITLNLNN
ncbi:hypothetical protein [Parasediminibacterium sp. JCM 36343]|uniref:hypothetical protein n=1 Tax=Parasediminibacterium sp. JCM 36343 TaxID=3374279 RepID=UPI00397B2391